MRRFAGTWIIAVVLALPVWGSVWASEPNALPDGGQAKVVHVVDGDTVVLDDGRQVRLVGIQAPKLALGRANFRPWPLADEAKAFVEDRLVDKRVTLRLAPQPKDRHGRVLAHVVRSDDGLWLQGALLQAGLARVYTFPDNRVLAAAMLALERQARADKKGIWGLPYYAVRTDENVRVDINTFQLVEGRVLDVAHIKNRVYMNFGVDWRTDFTIKVMTRDEPQFTEAGMDLMALKGQRVRVRGWIVEENGAMIKLDHPQRLEVLGE